MLSPSRSGSRSGFTTSPSTGTRKRKAAHRRWWLRFWARRLSAVCARVEPGFPETGTTSTPMRKLDQTLSAAGAAGGHTAPHCKAAVLHLREELQRDRPPVPHRGVPSGKRPPVPTRGGEISVRPSCIPLHTPFVSCNLLLLVYPTRPFGFLATFSHPLAP